MGDGGYERDDGTRASHRVVQRGERESRRRGRTRWVAGLGRKEALLARRKELQIRTQVARRMHYRKTVGRRKMPEQAHLKCTLIHLPICANFAEGEHKS